MEIDNIKKEILTTNDKQRLYEIKIELSITAGKLHTQLNATEEPAKRCAIKGKLDLIRTLKEVINDRLLDL